MFLPVVLPDVRNQFFPIQTNKNKLVADYKENELKINTLPLDSCGFEVSACLNPW